VTTGTDLDATVTQTSSPAETGVESVALFALGSDISQSGLIGVETTPSSQSVINYLKARGNSSYASAIPLLQYALGAVSSSTGAVDPSLPFPATGPVYSNFTLTSAQSQTASSGAIQAAVVAQTDTGTYIVPLTVQAVTDPDSLTDDELYLLAVNQVDSGDATASAQSLSHPALLAALTRAQRIEQQMKLLQLNRQLRKLALQQAILTRYFARSQEVLVVELHKGLISALDYRTQMQANTLLILQQVQGIAAQRASIISEILYVKAGEHLQGGIS
jgi:hypothetical protein